MGRKRRWAILPLPSLGQLAIEAFSRSEGLRETMAFSPEERKCPGSLFVFAIFSSPLIIGAKESNVLRMGCLPERERGKEGVFSLKRTICSRHTQGEKLLLWERHVSPKITFGAKYEAPFLHRVRSGLSGDNREIEITRRLKG